MVFSHLSEMGRHARAWFMPRLSDVTRHARAWFMPVLYIGLVTTIMFFPPANNFLRQSMVIRPDIGVQLEFSSVFAATFTVLAMTIKLALGGARRNHRAGSRGTRRVIVAIFLVLSAVLLALQVVDVVTDVFKFGDNRTIWYLGLSWVLALSITLFDGSDFFPSGKRIQRAVLFAADYPLNLGLTAVLVFAWLFWRSGMPARQLDVFIGGAQTFKLVYYEIAYTFIHTRLGA